MLLCVFDDAWVLEDTTIRAMHAEPHNIGFISCAPDHNDHPAYYVLASGRDIVSHMQSGFECHPSMRSRLSAVALPQTDCCTHGTHHPAADWWV